MPYFEATISATANPAQSMMDTLDPLLTSNGWVFVETYTSSTNVSNIYRSPSANNSTGADFYIAVNRVATTAAFVAMCIFEEWDATGKRCIKYAPNGTVTAASNVPGASGEIQDATGVLPSVTTSGASLLKSVGFTLSTSGWTYYLNITANRIIACTSIGTDGFYCGAYDPFYNTSRPALCVVDMGDGNSSTSTSQGAVTREPLTGSSAGNWHIQEYKASSIPSNTQFNSFAPNIYTSNPTDAITGANLVFKKMVIHSRGSVGNPIGLYKDVLTSYVGTNTGAPGDTLSYTIGGTTYNYVSGTKNITTASAAAYWIPKQ